MTKYEHFAKKATLVKTTPKQQLPSKDPGNWHVAAGTGVQGRVHIGLVQHRLDGIDLTAVWPIWSIGPPSRPGSFTSTSNKQRIEALAVGVRGSQI